MARARLQPGLSKVVVPAAGPRPILAATARAPIQQGKEIVTGLVPLSAPGFVKVLFYDVPEY
jgi:hypothetical protein